MTVSSWGDVPAGMPVHWHCLATIESKNDPQYWTDASTAAPDLVAWHPADVLDWVYEQLSNHIDQVEAKYGRQEHAEAALASYRPFGDLPPVTADSVPDTWQSLANTLQCGRWAMLPYQLSMSRLLTMQILGYADKGQPKGFRNKKYVVCAQHNRPGDRPYSGLAPDQVEHFEEYGALFVPA